jgi:hypothetical protein
VYYHSVSLQQARSPLSPRQRRHQRNNTNNDRNNRNHLQQHAKQSQSPSDSFILRQLQKQTPNYMVQYLRLDDDSSSNETNSTSWDKNDSLSATAAAAAASRILFFQPLQNAVQGILENYDFLIVTEEMEASLIVLGWIMKIDLPDLLLLSSKTTTSGSGNSYNNNFYYNGRRCIRLVPPVRTPAINAYFLQNSKNNDNNKNDNNNNNDNWPTRHAADRLLHMAANESLYRTIEEQVTWPIFRQRQAALRQLQNAANRACAAEIALQQPCIHNIIMDNNSSITADNNTRQQQGPHFNIASQKACYIRDFGCGFACYNRFVDETIATTT